MQKSSRHRLFAVLGGWAALGLIGCLPNTKSGRGFRPPPGDATRGRQAFVQLQCTTCHRVEGEELPAPNLGITAAIPLGGEVRGAKTYGQLVTAIIHPSEPRWGRKPVPRMTGRAEPLRMPTANDKMTVQQLLDLVTFLQSHYREAPPRYSDPGFPIF